MAPLALRRQASQAHYDPTKYRRIAAPSWLCGVTVRRGRQQIFVGAAGVETSLKVKRLAPERSHILTNSRSGPVYLSVVVPDFALPAFTEVAAVWSMAARATAAVV